MSTMMDRSSGRFQSIRDLVTAATGQTPPSEVTTLCELADWLASLSNPDVITGQLQVAIKVSEQGEADAFDLAMFIVEHRNHGSIQVDWMNLYRDAASVCSPVL